MNRIKQIRIVPSSMGRNYVTFMDAVDIENILIGKTYRPSFASLARVCNIIEKMKMVCRIDLNRGIITAKVNE